MFGAQASPSVSQAVMEVLASSYRRDSPTKEYSCSFYLEGSQKHVRVRSRSPFAARAAVISYFGPTGGDTVRVRVKQTHRLVEECSRILWKDRHELPEVDAELRPLPAPNEVERFAYERALKASYPLKRSREQKDRLAKEVADTYTDDASLSQFVGYVLLDQSVQWVSAQAHGHHGAVAAAIIEFGDHYPMAFWDLDNGGLLSDHN